MTATIGIRAEDKSAWERRTPLVPSDVERLRAKYGLRFVVQTSRRRIYDDDAYRRVGAEIHADLADADVVLAVKEIPPEKLLPGKTSAFFAHVIKGQPQNMPLLHRLLERRVTLIDYERITDGRGVRLVRFSFEAGQAGMITCLHFLGRLWARDGYETPLLAVRRAHEYDDLDAAVEHIATIGERLRAGFEIDQAPPVVGFTGRGHVSRGAQDIFDLLPHETVDADRLLAGDAAGVASGRFLKTVFDKSQLYETRDGTAFDDQQFRHHPDRFRSRFARYLPHLSLLINGIFWTSAYPRIVTRREVAAAWRAGHRKLRLIGDVSCDVDGAIELTYKTTDSSDPVYIYDPLADEWHDGVEGGSGIGILAVDNLPCELPRDASRTFSRTLRDFLPAIAAADYRRPFARLDLPPEIRRAVITHHGELTPDYRYLQAYLPQPV